MKIIDSLLVSLGFKVEMDGLHGFASKVEEIKHTAKEIALVAAEGVNLLGEMVHGAVERLGGIQNFAEQMGMSAREVDALGKVARENDSSLEAMEAGLRQLTVTAGQAAQGVGRGALIFQKYGMHARDANGHVKTTDQLLGDVADKLAKLPSSAQKQAFGARFGFDPATIKLMSEGREEFMRLRAEALKDNPFGDEDYERADQAEKSMRKAGDAVQKLKERLAVALIPTVERLTVKFTAWARDEQNIQRIQRAIDAVARAVELLVQHADKLVAGFVIMKAKQVGDMFTEWGERAMKFGEALHGASGRSAGLKAALGGLKGVVTGGLLGLFLLVAEDLWVYYHGGVSVTGWMMTKFPAAVDVMLNALELLGAGFLALTLGSGPVGVFAFAIAGIAHGAMSIKGAWNPLVQWFGEKIDWLVDKLKAFYNLVASAARLVGIDMSDAKRKAPTGAPSRKEQESDFEAMVREQHERAAQRRAVVQTLPGMSFMTLAGNMAAWAPAGPGSEGKGSTVINNTHAEVGPTTINVNGAQSPQEVAREIGRLQASRDRRAMMQARDAQAGTR